MVVWFSLCIIGFLLTVPLHFLSMEKRMLKQKLGIEKGLKIGNISGFLSGWIHLLSLIGLWISPQPKLHIFYEMSFSFSYYVIPIMNFSIGLPLIIIGSGIAIWGVKVMSKEVGFKVIDIKSTPDRIVSKGPYSIVRHPQYLGANLVYIGGSLLFSSFYAILFTPVYIFCNYLISWREEEELIKEFKEEYGEYKDDTSMFIPGL